MAEPIRLPPDELARVRDLAHLGLSENDAHLALCIAEGRSNRAIAALYDIPVGTVATRVWRLYRRLGLPNRAKLGALVGRLQAEAAEARIATLERDTSAASTHLRQLREARALLDGVRAALIDVYTHGADHGRERAAPYALMPGALAKLEQAIDVLGLGDVALESPYATDQVLCDLLSLVLPGYGPGETPTREDIADWTPAQREAAGEWAAAVLARSSGWPETVVPEKPAHVAALEVRRAKVRSDDGDQVCGACGLHDLSSPCTGLPAARKVTR